MMFWYDHGVSGWGWLAMTIGMLLFWAVIIGAGVLLYRAVSHPPYRTHDDTSLVHSPEQLLAERFARGEIDEDEYRRRLETLHAAPSSPPTRHA
jgi:putative membrane protein